MIHHPQNITLSVPQHLCVSQHLCQLASVHCCTLSAEHELLWAQHKQPKKWYSRAITPKPCTRLCVYERAGRYPSKQKHPLIRPEKRSKQIGKCAYLAAWNNVYAHSLSSLSRQAQNNLFQNVSSHTSIGRVLLVSASIVITAVSHISLVIMIDDRLIRRVQRHINLLVATAR